MPAKDENAWESLCEEAGVKREEMVMLKRKGITDSGAARAKEFGISAKDIRDLYFQFGEPFPLVFATLITMVKHPKHKDSDKEPTAKKPPRDEAGSTKV